MKAFISPDMIWQMNFDKYRKKALEYGYTEEEADRVIERVKRLYRGSRHPLQLPPQLRLLWASHQLLDIEREMDGLLY